MDYKLIPYTDEFYEFVYDLKKTVYKKYVEECWGEWNELIQQEMFGRFIDSVKEDTHLIFSKGQAIGFYNASSELEFPLMEFVNLNKHHYLWQLRSFHAPLKSLKSFYSVLDE